jgi:hypothetical protein
LLAFFVEMPDSSLHQHELISAQVPASKKMHSTKIASKQKN